MKGLILFLMMFFTSFCFSQNIQFADPDLLTYLTTRLCVDTNGDGSFNSNADFNNDGQIQTVEAQQVLSFSFSTLAHNIQDISGFEMFSNLEELEVTTIQINHLDFSLWQSLRVIKLSSSIDSFNFNNPSLTHFELQNVGFNNPLFDLSNLSNLEYVKVQSDHLTDNLIFGTHNNLRELRIVAGTFSSLDLLGMPSLEYLVIDKFIGTSLDISNSLSLKEITLKYTDNLNSINGIDLSVSLEKIYFIQENVITVPSNLDLSFNNQSLKSVLIRGAKTISLNNNFTDIGSLDLYFIKDLVSIKNSNFNYINSSLDATLNISGIDTDQLFLENLSGIKFLRLQNIVSSIPLDLTELETESITIGGCSFTELNLKNGNILQQFYTDFTTDIEFICVDNDEFEIVQNGYSNSIDLPVIHPYCTFVLGGDYFEINGSVLLDIGAGCISNINVSNIDIKFTVTDGTAIDVFYPDGSNQYLYTLPEGSHTLNSEIMGTNHWVINPPSINLNFPAQTTPVIQDFCLTPNGILEDLEVIVVPLEQARPGFDTDYKVVVKNKGNVTTSGSVTLDFEEDFMTLLSTNPNAGNTPSNQLSWSFSGLQPFQMEEYEFTTTLNTPTATVNPLNGGDILTFTGTVTGTGTDAMPADNIMVLDQTVVNSYDPNDKTCLEGETIYPADVGEYVHYMIRFENTGTASAINVVIKDEIDLSQFDITTLIPLGGSHNYYTRIREGNIVEFIHENINLDFNDATNDGHVLFKIKTLNTLVAGDTFDNTAEIFFDFNFPIITNTETVTVMSTASIRETTDSSITVYPNPASGFISLSAASSIESATIMDINGRTLSQSNFTGSATEQHISIENLSSGIYFVTIQSEVGQKVEKLIVE